MIAARSARGPLPALLPLLCCSLFVGSATTTPAADGHIVWNTMYRATVIEDDYANSDYHQVVPDGAGGVIVAWQHDGSGGIRLQRLDHAGSQLWPAAGVVLSSTGEFPSLSAHPGGGYVVAWQEANGIYVQRVSSAGAVQWTAGGVRIGATGQQPVVCATWTAGTFVMWRSSIGDARIGNVDNSGVPTAPGLDGVSLGANAGLYGDMALVASGSGSVIAIWPDDQYPQRVLSQKVGPGFPWGSTPTVLASPVQSFNAFIDADTDGSGGAVVAWRATITGVQIRAQRIDSAGATQWGSGGVVLVDSTVVGGNPSAWALNYAPAIAPDGDGGAYVAWTDWRHSIAPGSDDDVYMQHVGAGGNPFWAVHGQQLGADPSGSERLTDLIPDRVGGVIVSYGEVVNYNWEAVVGRFNWNGFPHWEYPPYHDATGDAIDQTRGMLAYDGGGPTSPGAIVVFIDQDEWNLYAQKVEVSWPANDACPDAQTVEPASYELSLVGAGGELDVSCSPGPAPDTWFLFTAPADGSLAVATCGTHDGPGTDLGMDTLLSLHSACPDGGMLYELDCNDDWPGSANPDACVAEDTGLLRDSWVQTPVTAEQQVWIRASRYPTSFDGGFWLHVIFEPFPPPNDACADSIPIGPGTHVGVTIAASTDGSTTCATGSENDVWYRYTAPWSSVHHFSTCGTHDLPGMDAGPDTVLSIHSACPETGDIHQITCDDDAVGTCGAMDQGTLRDARFAYAPAEGETVWIRVARMMFGEDGEFLLHVEPDAPAAGRVPRDDWMEGEPLMLTKVGAYLQLTWVGSCMPWDNDYAVYMGPLGGWGLHSPLACSTGNATHYDFLPPAEESVYFIVAPHNGAKEGSHGTERYGTTVVERVASSGICYEQEIGVCP